MSGNSACKILSGNASYSGGIFQNEGQPRAFRELTREIDNIRISWKRGVDQSQWSLLRKGLYCFWGVHEYRAWYREGFNQLEKVAQAIVASNQSDDSGKALLGQALAHKGWFQFRLGQLGDAWALTEKGLDYLRPLEDQTLLMQPLIQAGLLKQHMGNTGETLQMTEAALVIAETSGDNWAKAWCHCNQGIIKRVMGSVEQAHEHLRLALDEFRVQVDPRLIAITLIYLGPTAIDLGHLDEAHGLLQESLSLSIQFGDSLAMGPAYNNLGLVALAQHNFMEAKRSFEKALELFSLLGIKGYIANSLAKLGTVAIAMQDVDKAKDLLTTSIKTAVEVHAMPVVHEALAGMARIEMQTGNEERAIELALWLLGQPASTQATKGYANQVLQETRDFFNEDQIQIIHEKMMNEPLEVIVNTIV